MESSPRVVIKVKYGDVLRRFDALIGEDELILTMNVLKRKILSLFSLTPDTELILTYVDEDNDVVNLVDDDDVRDVLRQGLNPLRITVAVSTEESGKQSTDSSVSSSHLRTAPLVQSLQTGVSENLGTFPELACEALVKLSADLASKDSSIPGVGELDDFFAELGMTSLDQVLESHTRNNLERARFDLAPTLGVPSDEASNLPSKNIESLEKLEPHAVNRSNEVKISTVVGGRVVGISTFDSTAVAAALDSGESVMGISTFDSTAVAAAIDSLNMHATIQSNVPLPIPCYISPGHTKEVKKTIETTPLSPASPKAGKIIESDSLLSNLPPVVNVITAGKAIDELPESTLESTQANAGVSDPKSGKYIFGAGKSELSNVPSKSCLQQVPSLVMGPFSGTAVGNDSFVPPNSASKSVFSGRSVHGRQKIVHHGVCCDGCDINPIGGPRFKSKLKEDYDLCSTCFEEFGNDKDYIRMDFPAVNRVPFTCHAQDQGCGSTLSYAPCHGVIKPVAINLDSSFIGDVNIFDGTVMAPSTPFTKIWRMRNNGTVGWLQGTKVVWIGGAKMSNMISVQLRIPEGGVWMDQELSVMVGFISPDHPGMYTSYWRMATPAGETFGQVVWVLIQVASKETQREKVRNLNLNLPPESPENFKVDIDPRVIGNNQELGNTKEWVDLSKPIVEQDLKFPLNNNLFIGDGASSFAFRSAVPLPFYHEGLTPFSLPSSEMRAEAPFMRALCPAADNSKKNQVEKLLGQLEDMGFNIDLNKEIYSNHRILDALKELGFNNRMLNEVLVKKNKGNIRRVLMELVSARMS